ncbi:hypothetical protein GCM10007876_19840 [Litoribrevibacter albus]|uniref:Uncharacterized protein n=1 Tax=Litoribrevibacter albus TaxID=1473156 RepID=A0AA37SAL4_9GAMM|nr:hypothetical protein GCM10007876_19840 [Litoribrevibacter albus]
MVEVAVIDGFVNTVKLLIFEIPNARHKVESEQMTECEDDFGIAMCIGGVLPDFQNRVVFAYSRPRLPLIPDEACHPFHAKAATDSTAKLPPWQAA